MSTWQDYINLIQHTFDVQTGAWSVVNVCEHAAIYGTTGRKWAATEGFELADYTFQQEQMDGTFKDLPCEEAKSLIKCCKGEKKGG